MLSPAELKETPVFSCLGEADLLWVSQRAADLRPEPGEYVIQEGEPPFFYVLIDGITDVLKDIKGRPTVINQLKAGAFFGELPILMSTGAHASARANTRCRLARLDPQHFQELIRRSAECSALILQTLNARVQLLQKYMLNRPTSRVQIIASKFDDECRDIRAFLSMNRIPYEWLNREHAPELVLPGVSLHPTGPSVVVDDAICVSHPTVRNVAEALRFQTTPKRQSYDVVIVGGGPAGLAAAVYGSSEGLRILLVERNAAGGQAGTSTRIENFLGFPNGISGDDLSQRALRQALKFGTEVILTREVQEIRPGPISTYTVVLDGQETVETKTVILATGVNWRRLDAEGVDRFIGRGVVYGAARAEALTVTGKDVVIVGGGNSAGQAALFFANYANSVTMLLRGAHLKRTMSQYLIDQIVLMANIHVETETVVNSADGTDCLKTIRTRKDGESDKERIADALFVMIGADAETDWLPAQLLREGGYIRAGREVTDLAGWTANRTPFLLETNLPGIFCVGDVRYNSIKRVSSSVGEGSMVIAFVHQYLSLLAAPNEAKH